MVFTNCPEPLPHMPPHHPCMMDSHVSQVALLFLCQPSFSNHLFLLVTSPRSCPCGVVMSVDAQSMQPMRPSEVSAIITSLWCLVFVVWCPQSPLLFPHSLVASSIGCAMCGGCNCMVLCCLNEWNECTFSHTQRKKEDSTQVCLCGVLGV